VVASVVAVLVLCLGRGSAAGVTAGPWLVLGPGAGCPFNGHKKGEGLYPPPLLLPVVLVLPGGGLRWVVAIMQ